MTEQPKKSIGTCIPCSNGQHGECNGPGSSLGCLCMDRDHKPKDGSS